MDLVLCMSELDPTWNNDELNFYQSRGGGSNKTQLQAAACTADAVFNRWKPFKTAFWCAGSGTQYPFVATRMVEKGVIRDSSLRQGHAALHQWGLVEDNGFKRLCERGVISPTLPNQYKSMVLINLAKIIRYCRTILLLGKVQR